MLLPRISSTGVMKANGLGISVSPLPTPWIVIRCSELLQLLSVYESRIVNLFCRDSTFTAEVFHRLPVNTQNDCRLNHVQVVVKNRHFLCPRTFDSTANAIVALKHNIIKRFLVRYVRLVI